MLPYNFTILKKKNQFYIVMIPSEVIFLWREVLRRSVKYTLYTTCIALHLIKPDSHMPLMFLHGIYCSNMKTPLTDIKSFPGLYRQQSQHAYKFKVGLSSISHFGGSISMLVIKNLLIWEHIWRYTSIPGAFSDAVFNIEIVVELYTCMRVQILWVHWCYIIM